MEETLDMLHVHHKGRMMNTLESYLIQLNEALIESYNPIFEIIIKKQPNKNLSTIYNQTPPHPPNNLLPPPT
jgi:hypothetical protein